MAYGTLSVSDLLATEKTIAEIGEDVTWQAVDASLAAHNTILREQLSDFVEITTDRQRRYGGLDTMQMDELDEFGTPDAQKVSAGTTVGFPMRLYGGAVQWTRKYFQNTSGNEFLKQFTAMQDGDVKNMTKQLKRAVFLHANTTFVDKLLDYVTIYPKALVNADSAPLPVGPNGETFTASTHTHYLYTAGATLAAADLVSLITTVVEHWAVGRAMVYINQAQESAVRALAGFIPYTPAEVIVGTAALVSGQPAAGARGILDTTQIGNRAIGIFGNQGAQVWVKPWIPSGYLFAFIEGAPKPLCLRERNMGAMGLTFVADNEMYPLRARQVENEFGVAVWQRTAGAALYIDSGSGGAYVDPTIT